MHLTHNLRRNLTRKDKIRAAELLAVEYFVAGFLSWLRVGIMGRGLIHLRFGLGLAGVVWQYCVE